ncbi:MAG: sugar MFS transporter [Azospirillaceae bacterium]|nr:sugar MFS transporter [Azospirillaceae bacterium]
MAAGITGVGAPVASGPVRSYGRALAVLASIFFMWGFATVLNDILVPHLRSVFDLSYGQSLLIQFIFFLAYFVMSLPSAKVLERVGYKRSVVAGLGVMALGSLMFVPAAALPSFPIFLVALFVLASGITLLQVAANPYVAVIGPAESASSRLNLVQAFNSLGTTVAPLFGGILIFNRSTSGNATGGTESALTDAQRLADAHAVQLPYVLITLILLGLAVIIWRFKLPDLGGNARRVAAKERAKESLWRHRNLVFGVPAIFIYLIAEIGIGSMLVNYLSLPNIGNLSHADAAGYVSLFWGGAMVGRFVGSFAMRWIRPQMMLAAVSVAAFILTATSIATGGSLAMWTIILVGLCHSIMFPTIFTLGIKGLGPLTEEGSGLLIMAIAGGALAAGQGFLADRIGLQLSFALPAACYLYVLFYALWGSRPTHDAGDETLSTLD